MNPIVRYLTGSLVYAAVYYLVGRILWSEPGSAVPAILRALTWGLVIQALFMRAELLKKKGKQPYAPMFYFVAAVAFLCVAAFCWFGSSTRPRGVELLVPLIAIGLAVLMAYGGVQAAQRSRGRGVQPEV